MSDLKAQVNHLDYDDLGTYHRALVDTVKELKISTIIRSEEWITIVYDDGKTLRVDL